jgi:hypothetical protein
MLLGRGEQKKSMVVEETCAENCSHSSMSGAARRCPSPGDNHSGHCSPADSWAVTRAIHIQFCTLWVKDVLVSAEIAKGSARNQLVQHFTKLVCYTLNLECPLRLICWRFGSQCSNVQRWSFGEAIRPWGLWPPKLRGDGISGGEVGPTW